jgi:DNA polymerase-3 subunit delta
MQVRADQLSAHLQRGLKPAYTLHGDEPLLAQEAADAIRAPRRARRLHRAQGVRRQRCALRLVGTAGCGAGDEPVRRAPADRDPHPRRQARQGRLRGLQRYCDALSEDVLTLVHLPTLDGSSSKSAWFGALDGAGVTVRSIRSSARALPQWIAQRLAAQGQRVAAGRGGQRTLAFFADRVEGNLLAAHQELQKLALLYPAGELELRAGGGRGAQRGALRRVQAGEAVLAGQVRARAAHARRPARRRRGRGAGALDAGVRHPALKRVKDAWPTASPLPMALREARVWGPSERLFERVLPRWPSTSWRIWWRPPASATAWSRACAPGLAADPWDALKRLVLLRCRPWSAPHRLAAARRCIRRPTGARGLTRRLQRMAAARRRLARTRFSSPGSGPPGATAGGRAEPRARWPPHCGALRSSVSAAACGSTVTRGWRQYGWSAGSGSV